MITFGITDKEINLIEYELEHNWNVDDLEFKYSYHFWTDVAKKCGWEALTFSGLAQLCVGLCVGEYFFGSVYGAGYFT